MTKTGCPTQTELSAAFSNGPTNDVRQHLASCPRCSEEWSAIDRVVNSYRKLPWPDSSPSKIEEQRTALLASAALARPPTMRRWVRWTVPMVAAAAVALVLLQPNPTKPDPVFHGTLTPRGETVFIRTSSGPDEVVTLASGALFVEVSPLKNGERFRIVTSDAEVEVRGTAFEVTAEDGRLVAVHVWHGKVEVRPTTGGSVVLGGGESWARPAITASTPPVVPTVPAGRPFGVAADATPDATTRVTQRTDSTQATGPRKVLTSPRPVTGIAPVQQDRQPDVGALAYQEAWSALRAGDPASAAKGFERAATIAPSSGLAEEAWYWRAVSLARSKQSAEARAAFALFLEKYGNSPRAAQASAMLGWLLFEATDLDGAEVRFRAASSDPDPTIHDSAIKGLEAVRRRRSE